MVCKHCGKALGDEAKFCPYCGNKVELSFSYCPACGEEVEDQMTFCPACGYELDKALEEGGLDEFFEQPATQVGKEAVAVSAEPVKVENTEKKTKFKTVTIMKLVSSALLVVVALLAIFLPLCNVVSYEVVNEESVRVTNQMSLLALTIKYIQAIMASGKGLSFNLTMMYGLLYLLFVVSILAIAWMGVKKLLECVKGLQNFDQYCEQEFSKSLEERAAQERLASTKKVSKYGTWGGIFMDLALCVCFVGLDAMVKSTLIVIGVLCVVGGILDWIVKNQENNVWKM